jgi:hypothetical protein
VTEDATKTQLPAHPLKRIGLGRVGSSCQAKQSPIATLETFPATKEMGLNHTPSTRHQLAIDPNHHHAPQQQRQHIAWHHHQPIQKLQECNNQPATHVEPNHISGKTAKTA